MCGISTPLDAAHCSTAFRAKPKLCLTSPGGSGCHPLEQASFASSLLREQGFLVYPKSAKSEPFLAILGKSQNTPRESEKWHTCTLAYLRVETLEELKP